MILLTVFFALGALTCGGTVAIAPAKVPGEVVDRLRTDVAEAIRPDCGSCHTSGLQTAKPGALAVFDLAERAWSSRMSEEQLHGFHRRTRDLDSLGVVKVDSLVAAELARFRELPVHQ